MKFPTPVLLIPFFPVCYSFTSPFDVALVKSVLKAKASASWEFGTASEALLELDTPLSSVFGSSPFTTIPASTEALAYAASHIVLGGKDLVPSTSTNTDPASLGVFAVMLGWNEKTYGDAATTQLGTLLYNTPRAANGAISHRSGSVALWSDFVYMAPPFIAYYAANTNNKTLLNIAVQQCADYRAVLKTSKGPWEHISATSHPDTGLWSTGNGWAAMGMARVLGTVVKSAFTDSVKNPLETELVGWVKEILDGAMATARDSSGLLYNYLGNTSSLAETSGTSLLAATVYRMAVLEPSTFGAPYINWANASLKAIAKHVGSNGIVSPAVDPYGYTSTTPYTTGSPEGQAFAVMLYAAYRDCVGVGVCS